ncbi:MAG: ATP cone domain-containing protein [Archaeoglobaceae archaeon]|nr:ATP cone domain-containing protein [Archaeoglobaceae archaeon]MCX8152047.1 ATP cone domain-containing protein [Archaeoglobaceae archaeon]MDW8013812.1 ATP cone domain-containing protein [Archaeoglobaceae archaeon]
MIKVLKRDGRLEPFNREKVLGTCLKAGVPIEVAEEVLKEVEKKIYDGITTDEILNLVLFNLKKYKYSYYAKYNLKNSLIRLGPAGYAFEKFVAKLLEKFGYKVKTNLVLEGKCTKQEVDVYAEFQEETIMVECKFHNFPTYTGLKEIMYTYARFLDLEYYFDSVWIFTNTKFSEEAIKYAECKKMKFTGWNQPNKSGIEKMLEKMKLYPVTMLDFEDKDVKKLINSGLVFCNDILEAGLKKLREIGFEGKEDEILQKASEIFK